MDLGIAGKTALVCASSQGLGKGCAAALAEAGCRVIINGRDRTRVEAAAAELAAGGAMIIPVAADVATPEGRKALLDAAGAVDILVNNNAGPPLRDFRQIDHEAMIAGLEANMLAPIEMLKGVIDGMAARGFGRIVNITSSAVKAPIPGLDLSSGARAGLTAFVAGVARVMARHGVTINQIMPGAFDTERLRSNFAHAAQSAGAPVEQILAQRRAAIPAQRFGAAAEFGALCAFLCSSHAAYITGQSILIDGGAIAATL